MDIKQIISRRKSIRTYRDEPISSELKKKLEDYITCVASPFESRQRFVLLDTGDIDIQNVKLGTYGTISGAKTFICAITEKAERYEENLGYAFEKIVLYATSLGLGTCWLGGTFNRSAFGKALHIKENEFLPIVSPVGYAKDKRSLVDAFFVMSAGSNRRKDWSEIFFDGNFGTPLERVAADKYADILDMVRMAPSASNKQPWRIVKCGNMFHFYLNRTLGYKGVVGFDIQRLDIGIAMCHFDLMAQELGIAGKWVDKNPGFPTDSHTEYIVTYTIQDTSR